MLRLECENEGKPLSFDLGDGTHIVGRASSCDVVIKNPGVSGQHVRLDVSGDTVKFRDLLSKNGVYVNGAKVAEGELKPGDALRLGRIPVTLAFGDAPARTARPTPPPAAAQPAPVVPVQAQPLDFSPPPGGAAEETPADMAFAPPAVVEHKNLAVEVVRPVASAPAEGGSGRAGDAALKRKKLLVGVLAAGAVLLVGIMMMPTTQQNNLHNTPQGSAENFWTDVKSGIAVFDQGDYAKAGEIWTKADLDLKASGGDKLYQKRPAARLFARIAGSFAAAAHAGAETTPIDWAGLYTSLMDFAETNDVQVDEVTNFVNNLRQKITRENQAQQTYATARQLFSSQNFAAAKRKFAEIPVDSLYYKAIGDQATVCDRKMDEAARAAAQSLYGAGTDAAQVQQALGKLGTIPFERQTAQDKTLAAKWRTDVDVLNLVAEARRLAGARNRDERDRAVTLIDEIRAKYSGHPAAAGLDELKRSVQESFYLEDVKAAFDGWDQEALGRLEADARSTRSEAKEYFQKASSIRAQFAQAKLALAQGDYLGARQCYESVRRLAPVRGHPANAQAQNEQYKIRDEVLGGLYVDESRKAFGREEYRRARRLLELAGRFNADTKADVEELQKRGRKLFSDSVIKLSGKVELLAAKKLMSQAIECYLPGEDNFQKYVDRYKHEFADDPPDFDKNLDVKVQLGNGN